MRSFGVPAPGLLAACAAMLGWALVAVDARAGAPAPSAPPQTIQDASRVLPGGPPRDVRLPDTVTRSIAGHVPVVEPTYTLHADLSDVGDPLAIYLPGVLAPARVRVNGHTVSDHIREPVPTRPRGADRLLLAHVPTEFVRPGANEIEITLASPAGTSLSKVYIGDEEQLRRMRDRKVFLTVDGPVVASAVIMALSLCVLVLWVRQNREPLYAYFGFGGLLWALHTIWTVLPDPVLRQPHFAIWWTSGFAFFCAPLIMFCVRLAEWRLPRFERLLWIGTALGPAVLYAGYYAGVVGTVEQYWRLGVIAAVAVGVFAVGRYAWVQRNTQAMLLLAVGGIAFWFGLRDWLLDRDATDNNPVFLTSYSGLLFFPLVAWILIDNFVQTARALSRLNVELEGRVLQKSGELQRAADDMRLARDAAEAADRAKSSFLAVASHDLRQPAHALGLYVAALRGEELTAAQHQIVERMSASIIALDTMFNALLDISKMDAGAVVADVRPFDLAAMLHRVAGEFSSEAAAKRLRFSVRVATAARGLQARSDPVLVERIVRNLLGNAVKYTRAGGVLLTCRLRGARWRIEIWDTGPGIRPVDQERIFEEFFQLGETSRDQASGLGLGLSIVRRLSALLGHPLEVKSAVGRGSRFAFCLPATAEAARSQQPLARIGSLQGLAVGVVDDDPEVRASMSLLLRRWGCDVLAGESVDELIGQAGPRLRELVQVLVVDFQLREGHSGLDAIAAVTHALGARCPALIVSGAAGPETIAQLQASGYEWLIKPVAPARLRSWLIHARHVAVVLERAESGAAPPAELKCMS